MSEDNVGLSSEPAKSGRRIYHIKPPVWHKEGRDYYMSYGGGSTIVWRAKDGWRAGDSTIGVCVEPFGSLADAKKWCEARYYEWVEQFLESA